MVPADAPTPSRERLVAAVQEALIDHQGADPGDAGRLACLLVARERFAATVGARPGGALSALPPPFDGLALSGTVRAALDSFQRPVDPAAIGEGYEGTLKAGARGERGQFFTPEPVADVLVRWALGGVESDDGPPRVLDPAVGMGSFLQAALSRFRDHQAHDGSTLLDRLVGIDVDAVALQLAGLRLAAAADVPAPETLALHHGSFFDHAPSEARTTMEATATLPPVDVVVGNPPFVRAEALQPDVDHFRRHLTAFGPPGEAPLLDGPEALSRRSDAYVYFVTHATRFLRPGGRLALVLPTKWLMSEYGEGLRRFLRERYRVHAVVGFEGRTFGDALVDTALLLAERDKAAGPGGSLRFVRVDGPAGLLDAVSGDVASARAARVTERTQSALTSAESLARYLEAPGELLSLLESDPFVRLDALAEVARGTMTGANRFFFVDADAVERFGLEAHFLRPAVKSLRSVDRPALTPGDVDRRIVDVHDYAAGVCDGLDEDADPTAAVKATLAADGLDGLLAYVEHAEEAGWHTGRTCQSRPVWFALGPLRAPAAFVPKLLRERVFAIRNDAGAVPSNAIDGVWPDDGVDSRALLAVLCASAGQAAMEVTGRDEAGLLQLMTYETASLPTLDVRACGVGEREALARAGAVYAHQPGQASLEALDEAVDAAFDLPLSPATIREQTATLRRQRIDGAEPVAASAD